MAHPAMRMVGKGAEPLVLLHGFGGTMGTWDSVLPHLPADLPVVLVDLPGHGASLHSEGRGGAGRMAKAILAGLADAGIDRFHLGGHSMGGAVAALMAMRAPDRVISLSLVAPGGMAPEIAAKSLADFAAASTPDDLEARMRGMAAPGSRWPEGYFEKLAEARKQPGALEAIGETYDAMFPEGPEKGQGTLPRDQLAALPMPVAAIWGSEDTILPCPRSGDLPAGIDLDVVKGAGHMLPEEVPAAVGRFLSRMAGRAG